MAFMIPVVRNDWDVWMGSGNPRGRRSSPNEQFDESGCDIATPSATGSNRIFIENTHRKRSLAIEIRNQQHLRCHGGSLPSSFRSADLPVPLSGASPARYRRTRSVTPRIHAVSANGNLGSPRANGLESIPSSVNTQSEVTNSLPMSSEAISQTGKSGSQSSLQKFHIRLVHRLRRSLRLNSGSTSDGGETCDDDKGSRASS